MLLQITFHMLIAHQPRCIIIVLCNCLENQEKNYQQKQIPPPLLCCLHFPVSRSLHLFMWAGFPAWHPFVSARRADRKPSASLSGVAFHSPSDLKRCWRQGLGWQRHPSSLWCPSAAWWPQGLRERRPGFGSRSPVSHGPLDVPGPSSPVTLAV